MALLVHIKAIFNEVKGAYDITYLWTEEGWVYLAVVIDLFSRQVVGFAMSERMTRRLEAGSFVALLIPRRAYRSAESSSWASRARC